MKKMNKFVLSTLVAATAMTSTAWAEGTTIYVNADYTEETEGFGKTAFNSFISAVDFASQNESISKIEIESDIDETLKSDYGIKQDLTICAAEGKKYTVNLNTEGTWAIMSSGGTLSVDAGVELQNLRQLLTVKNGAKIVFNGSATIGQIGLWAYDTSLIINESANVKMGMGDGVVDIHCGSALTVNGSLENTTDAVLENAAQQLSGGYFQVRNTGTKTLALNNTYVSTTWLTTMDTHGIASNFTGSLDNSVFKTSGKFFLGGNNNKFNLTNGSRLIVGGDLAVGEGNIVSIDNSSVTAKTVSNNGKLSVAGMSTLNAETISISDGGVLNLSDGAQVTIDGDLSLNGQSFADTALTIDYSSKLNVGGVINFGSFVTLGGIEINTTNYTDGKTYKVIDTNGFSGVATCFSGDYLEFNNDIYVTEKTQSTLYVNSAYSESATGDVVNDNIVGYNAFANLGDIADKIATDGADTTIKFESDIETAGKTNFSYGSGKVIFDADKAVKIYSKQENDVTFSEKGDSDIVVGENVTFEMYCNSSDFNLWYGANLDLSGKIIGGQNWGALYFFYGNHTAHSTAKIGVGRIQNRHASLTVLGSENGKNRYSENVAIADRTDAQVDVNYLLNEGSTFTAKDTYVEAGVVFDSNQEVMRDGASAFNFVNTKLDTGKITIGYADSTFNAENCVITVKTGIHSAGDGSITNNGTISLTDSTLTAVNVTNTGSIVLNNGTLKVTGTFTNNGTLTMDSSSKIVDANDNTVGASLSAGSTVAVADANVSISAAAAGVVFKGASEIDTSTVTGGDVDALPDGVTIVSAWHFDVETNGKEVEVSTMIEKGLSLDTIKIFHKADTEEAEWKLFAVGTDGIVDYDAETGVLSFTTSSFSGYAVAAPEPSAFGLLAGLGAIALAVSRRRRNRR